MLVECAYNKTGNQKVTVLAHSYGNIIFTKFLHEISIADSVSGCKQSILFDVCWVDS